MSSSRLRDLQRRLVRLATQPAPPEKAVKLQKVVDAAKKLRFELIESGRREDADALFNFKVVVENVVRWLTKTNLQYQAIKASWEEIDRDAFTRVDESFDRMFVQRYLALGDEELGDTQAYEDFQEALSRVIRF